MMPNQLFFGQIFLSLQISHLSCFQFCAKVNWMHRVRSLDNATLRGTHRFFTDWEIDIFCCKIQFFGNFRKHFLLLQISYIRSFQFCAKVVCRTKGTSLELPAAEGIQRKLSRDWEMDIQSCENSVSRKTSLHFAFPCKFPIQEVFNFVLRCYGYGCMWEVSWSTLPLGLHQ